ncbi:MAG: isoprenylcysteine carboxylmethyltransferase family protein [Verrucomicrobia bacterium]|nr:isoprenylcysteine carboxylmethyltransferase family protein [Verrucomicrobiota bacterium]
MRSVIDIERTLLGVFWICWLVYWLAAAQRAAPNRRIETLLEGASYRVPLAIGIFLMVFWWTPVLLRIPTLWTQTSLTVGIGLAFTAAGLCFAVWARMHLGKYWSGRITLKVNHQVIQTGPYAWVRHPIYSGLILALFGTALTLGTISAFAGFAFMVISFVRKLKIEETWLCSQFGAEYEAYQQRVNALIPRL